MFQNGLVTISKFAKRFQKCKGKKTGLCISLGRFTLGRAHLAPPGPLCNSGSLTGKGLTFDKIWQFLRPLSFITYRKIVIDSIL